MAIASEDALRGTLLGGAVGDALGAPIEFMQLTQIRARFGPAGLSDLSPAYGKLGAFTDDTQMTLFTAEGLARASLRGEGAELGALRKAVHGAYLRWLLTQGGAHPHASAPRDGWLLAQRALWSPRAPGNTCLSALSASVPLGAPAQNDSKGCGTVMRVAPVGLLYPSTRRGLAPSACSVGAAVSDLTHGHPTGYLAGGYFAELIALLCEGEPLAEAATLALAPLRGEAAAREVISAVEGAIQLAQEGDPSAARAESLGGGWIAEEAVAIALYSALVAHDFRHGVLLAANISGDSDSTASMAGQLLGYVHGVEGIPGSWREALELADVVDTVARDLWALRSGNADRGALAQRYP
jgi:ADP-ribosylglycohydrolase